MADDTAYMQRALALAREGQGQVHPNPLVGAVIVKDHKIIGEGAHWELGQAHAEINALNSLSSSPENSTLFVNLEPCTYHGRTPPCVPAIIESGITRVVMGMLDPNPQVNGKGVAQLRAAGIAVEVGVLESECRELNRGFIRHMQTGLPWVTLKLAMTIDGFIADRAGNSKWITGEESRKAVHRWRAEHDAVLVGANTVAVDDPQLTVRSVPGQNPVRVVVEGRQSVPDTARVFNTPSETMTLLFTGEHRSDSALEDKPGVDRILLESDDEMIPWEKILRNLSEEYGILSVLVEGGAGVASSLMASGLMDELIIMTAPKILGRGLSPFRDLELSIDEALGWQAHETGSLGADQYVRYRRKSGE